MRRHNPHSARRPHPHSRHRSPTSNAARSERTRRAPHPAHARPKQPSAVVIRQPAPGLSADKAPAKKRVEVPRSVIKWRPAHSNSIRPPAVSITRHREPRSVCIEVRIARGVAGGIRVLHRGIRRRAYALDSSGNPLVKVIARRRAFHGHRIRVSRFQGKRLILLQRRVLSVCQRRQPAVQHVYAAPVVEIVHPERCPRFRLHAEVAACHAEIVAAARIYVKLRRPLPQYQPCREPAILARQIKKFQYRVFRQERHRAVLKFHFRPAIVRRHNVTLPNRQIEHRAFPVPARICQRIAFHVARKPHTSLHQAQPHDSGMARLCKRGSCAASGNQHEHTNGSYKTMKAGHWLTPGGDVPSSRTPDGLARLLAPRKPGSAILFYRRAVVNLQSLPRVLSTHPSLRIKRPFSWMHRMEISPAWILDRPQVKH